LVGGLFQKRTPAGVKPAAGVQLAIVPGFIAWCYFSEVLIVPKVVLSLLPTPFTAVMIAIAIPAAIRPYSIAVAPDSFLMNFKMRDFTGRSNLVCLETRVQ
jgi:hypothetical protein